VPTPNIYSRIQVSIRSYSLIFTVLFVILLFAGILGLYFVPEGEISPKDSWIIYLPLLLCSLAVFLLWCITLSRFQMESIIRKIPLLAALHKLMVSDSKPWAEAIYLNITLIILFVFLAGGFSIFG
jgi:hypothetical protein